MNNILLPMMQMKMRRKTINDENNAKGTKKDDSLL